LARQSYPRAALRRGEQGWVPVRLQVDASGKILELAVVDRSTASTRLIEAALEAIRSAAPFPAFTNPMGAEPAEFELRVNYVIQ
jgi:TonB family protein